MAHIVSDILEDESPLSKRVETSNQQRQCFPAAFVEILFLYLFSVNISLWIILFAFKPIKLLQKFNSPFIFIPYMVLLY